MRNAEEFSGRRPGLARMPWAYRRPGRGAGGRPGSGRIRYAHGGALPRVEPYCTVPQGPAGHHGGDMGTGGAGGVAGGADPGTGTWLGEPGTGTWLAEAGTGAWLTEPPVGGRHGDLWVLVCGGIAAAAAFGAAFVASGGVASHPAAPGATMPAVVSQACPSPAAGPTP
jgi:hypothetical protein